MRVVCNYKFHFRMVRGHDQIFVVKRLFWVVFVLKPLILRDSFLALEPSQFGRVERGCGYHEKLKTPSCENGSKQNSVHCWDRTLLYSPGTKEKHLILDSDPKWESGSELTSCLTVILFNCWYFIAIKNGCVVDWMFLPKAPVTYAEI